MRRRGVSAIGAVAGLAAASAALAFAGGDINCHGGTCEGTNGNDVFFGSNQPERILAKGGLDFVFSAARGDDTIKFGPGADCGAGGEGKDRMFGGGGDDRGVAKCGPDDGMFGDEGADLIDGGKGADAMDGEEGKDELLGGPGDDFIDAGGGGSDTVDCGPGNDTVIANKGADTAKHCELFE